jgi:hypothetical protein
MSCRKKEEQERKQRTERDIDDPYKAETSRKKKI